MHTHSWVGGIAVGLGLVSQASAQQRDMQSFLTGVKPQDIVYQKVIDVPQFAGPNVQPQTSETFSVRRMLSKVFPFISASPKPSFQMSVPLLPGSNQGSPLQPVLPQFGLPQTTFGSPFFPHVLPTNGLPPVPDNVLKPVLPIP
jgi:hypothetical protein